MPCATVLATRSASSSKSGKRSATACASPSRANTLLTPAPSVFGDPRAATSALLQRCGQPRDHAAGGFSFCACCKCQSHAVLQHRLCKLDHVVDGGREPAVDQCLGSNGKH